MLHQLLNNLELETGWHETFPIFHYFLTCRSLVIAGKGGDIVIYWRVNIYKKMLTSGSFGPKNCSEEMDLALPNLSWALVEVSISNVFRLRLGLKVGQIEGTENCFRNIGNRLKSKCIW